MQYAAAICALVLVVCPALAGPDPVQEKLGEPYAKASSSEKLTMIAVAFADKRLDRKQAVATAAAVVAAEVGKGRDPKERLQRLGRVRGEAQAALKQINKHRREQKKPFVSFIEPDRRHEQAVAMAYIAFEAGPTPTLEQLGCLALVRECTGWVSTNALVLASAEGAFARDETFRTADLDGRLALIKKHTVDRGIMTDHERAHIERGVLMEWMSAELHAGKRAQDLRTELKRLKREELLSFFGWSWADGVLKGMEALPATPGRAVKVAGSR